MKKHLKLIFVVIFSIFLSGCSRSVLLSGLKEKEANDMTAILISQGIGAEKKSGAENTWEVWVDSASFAQSIAILNEAGYPKDTFSSIGDVFKKTGLVSSPLEERVRFMYALSENLSETLTNINGVVTARVHIVLPENDPYSEKLIPSSASVFITYLPDANIEDSVREIKYLVTNSIEGLQYDNVTIALFPAKINISKKVSASKTTFKKVLFFQLAPESVGIFWISLGFILIIMSILSAALGFFLWKFFYTNKKQTNTEE